MLLWEGPLECKPLPSDRMSMASLLPLLLRAPAAERRSQDSPPSKVA